MMIKLTYVWCLQGGKMNWAAWFVLGFSRPLMWPRELAGPLRALGENSLGAPPVPLSLCAVLGCCCFTDLWSPASAPLGPRQCMAHPRMVAAPRCPASPSPPRGREKHWGYPSTYPARRNQWEPRELSRGRKEGQLREWVDAQRLPPCPPVCPFLLP